jgi:hypothetical protein
MENFRVLTGITLRNNNGGIMVFWKYLLIIPIFLLSAGCYPGITGKVVDAATGRPISKALVVAQWTQTHGFGNTYHTIYKIVETETDPEGVFSLSGVYSPLVDQPRMIIFSKGYIPWRNDGEIEKSYEKYIWRNNETYKLKKLNMDYSRELLCMFIQSGFMGSNYRDTPKFMVIQREANDECNDEISRKRNKAVGGGKGS